MTTHNGQRINRLEPTTEPTVTASGPAIVHDDRPARTLPRREERALALIREQGGIHQSEFWKALDVSSRTGRRLAATLAEKDRINRIDTTHDGQRTYFLEPTDKDLDYSLLVAGEIISPPVGVDGEPDPLEADEFTEWILRLTNE